MPATSQPTTKNQVTIEIVGDERIIRANGIPNHKTGQFPNRGNPNRITAQRLEYRVPANPKMADEVTPMQGEFGVAVNGVPFDPGAAEFYDGEPGWQYEPLSGAIALGIDTSHAHVQPTGKYHYHGLPTGLLDAVKLNPKAHSPLIGWAADGFPMYAVYGYSDPKDPNSKIRKLKSSYQLKKGQRPGGDAPSGQYDGTFVRDYEYVTGSGDLDECNGMFTMTPEYPNGTYAYFMTEEWPVVPRFFRGTPSNDFMRGPGQGGRRGSRGRGELQGQFSQENQQRRQPLGQGTMRGPGRGGPGRGGLGGMPTPPHPGEVLPSFLSEQLGLSQSQQERVADLQKDVDQAFEKILSEEQQDILAGAAHLGRQGGPEGMMFQQGPGFQQGRGSQQGPGDRQGQQQGGPMGQGGPPGFQEMGRPPQPGEILPQFLREPLELTAKQTRELDALQTRVTRSLSRILTAEQQRMLQPPGPPGGPGGRGGAGFGRQGFGGQRPAQRPGNQRPTGVGSSGG